MADRCECGNLIRHPKGGGRRAKCETCSPPRGRRTRPVRLVPEPAVPVADLVGSVRAELEAYGRLDTAQGAMAMHAARLLVEGDHTGASAASLLRELRATVAEATKTASAGDDVVDELRAKRRARRGA